MHPWLLPPAKSYARSNQNASHNGTHRWSLARLASRRAVDPLWYVNQRVVSYFVVRGGYGAFESRGNSRTYTAVTR